LQFSDTFSKPKEVNSQKKGMSMKKYIPISISCISLLFLAHFTQDTSIAGREKPRVNFYGTITDRSGRTFKAENITISGAYKQIIMYEMPAWPDMPPKDHEVSIDLSEEKEIRMPDKPSIYTYNKRSYIEIQVIDQTTNTYIIEQSRHVYFDEPFSSGPKEHKVALEALKSIKIEGHKERDVQRKNKKITKNYMKKSFGVI
jgi:hypothetical protein